MRITKYYFSPGSQVIFHIFFIKFPFVLFASPGANNLAGDSFGLWNFGRPGSAVLFRNIKFKALNFAPEGRGMNTHLGGS